MAAQLYESSLRLAVELATPAPIDPQSSAYPYPALLPSGTTEQREFRCICLENPYLILTLVPDLGGRILRLLDKRTNAEIWSEQALNWHMGGDRRAFIPDGISLTLTGGPRLNESGPTDFMILPPGEEGSVAIWIAESSQDDLSIHLKVELMPESAEIRLEARVLNRRMEARHYNGGLSFGLLSGSLTTGGLLAWNAETKAGLLISSRELTCPIQAQALTYTRFDRKRSMAPRQLDTWSADLAVVSGIGPISAASRHVAVSFSTNKIALSSAADLENHKLLLLTQSEETLESPLAVEAESIRRYPLPAEIAPKSLAILTPSREELLRAEVNIVLPPVNRAEPKPNEPLEQFVTADSPEASFAWKNRALAENLKGLKCLAAGEYDQAQTSFELSLLYNAEDHLVWWYKAVAARHALAASPDSPDLPNAHYLAPLEPALRAEAFLSQPISPDPHPNPLLEPFKDTPTSFIEVACLLIEAGLFQDASRWLDESLRHVNLPMLRYLYAYCLVKAAHLPAEAATHLPAAESLPLTPPYPFRPIEQQALNELATHFPKAARLSEYRNLANRDR